MKNIYSIGEVLIDMMMKEEGIYEAKFGGAPANVAINLARFNAQSFFLGNFGDDHLGHRLYKEMKENNVKLDYASQTGKTSLAFVSWDEEGERDFQFYPESDQDYQVTEKITLDDKSIVHFGAATAFLGSDLEKSYFQLLDKSIKSSAYISFDPNYRVDLIKDKNDFKEKSLRFMKESDFIKLSLEEMEILFNTSDVYDVKNIFDFKNDQIFIVTLGKDGSYLYHNQKEAIIPSISVQQVDSTGAGDAFVSAMLYQIANNKVNNFNEIKDAVALANKVGALTSTAYGAIEAVPDINKL